MSVWWNPSQSNVTEAPGPLITAGWVPTQIPPAKIFNWIIGWFGGFRHFESLAAACRATSEPGQYAIVDNGLTSVGFGAPIPGEVANLGVAPQAWYSNGQELFYAASALSNTLVYRLAADAISLAPTTVTLSVPNGGAFTSIQANDRYLAIAYDTYVAVFDVVTGLELWNYNHGGDVFDVAICGDRLVMGGDAGTGAFTARQFSIAGGNTPVWSYNHGAAIQSVATSQDIVVIYGDDSGGIVGRRLSTLGALLWDYTSVNAAPAAPKTVATNGDIIVFALPPAASDAVDVFDVDGNSIGQFGGSVGGLSGLSMDSQYLYCGLTGGQIRAIDMRSVYAGNGGFCTTDNVLPTNGAYASTDGARLFATDAGGTLIVAYRGKNTSFRFRSVGSTGSPRYALKMEPI